MDGFYNDILRFGCLRGFTHFQLYLRGREELLVNVRLGSTGGQRQVPRQPTVSAATTGRPLPPASPASRNDTPSDPGEMVFLVGAYARYNWPYVWLRSNHGALSTADKDLPLDLKTTQTWNAKGAGPSQRVWHILEELVNLNVVPQPSNPFEVNFAAIAELPDLERMCATGATVGFLRDLLLQSDLPYAGLVIKDLEGLLKLHMADVLAFTKGGL